MMAGAIAIEEELNRRFYKRERDEVGNFEAVKEEYYREFGIENE